MAKKMDLDVGIHTNGAYPEVLRELSESGLVDGVFIDVKAPLDEPAIYARMIGYGVDPSVTMNPETVVEKVRDSIGVAEEYGILRELRTTVFPGFMDSHLLIGSTVCSILPFLVNSGVPYVIQQGRPSHALDSSLRDMLPIPRNDLMELSKAAFEHIDNVWVRTREKGSEKVNFEPV
jgi:pyruvate formate lyase activating enzyme